MQVDLQVDTNRVDYCAACPAIPTRLRRGVKIREAQDGDAAGRCVAWLLILLPSVRSDCSELAGCCE